MITTKQKSRSVLAHRTAVCTGEDPEQKLHDYINRLQSRLSSMRLSNEFCSGCGKRFEPDNLVVESKIAGRKLFTCMNDVCLEEAVRDIFDENELTDDDISEIVDKSAVDYGHAGDFRAIVRAAGWNNRTLSELEALEYANRG